LIASKIKNILFRESFQSYIHFGATVFESENLTQMLVCSKLHRKGDIFIAWLVKVENIKCAEKGSKLHDKPAA